MVNSVDRNKKEDTMATSNEAMVKAREFANRVGWFTPREKVKQEADLIPAI